MDKAKLINQAKKQLKAIQNEGQLNQLRSQFVGRKSQLATDLSQLAKLPISRRKSEGQKLNQLRLELEALFNQALAQLRQNKQFQPVDVTKPVGGWNYGHLHPTSQVLHEVYQIFQSLGFAIVDGPEVETDWYNFEVLNMPLEHPAREMQDTFYLKQHHRGRPLIPRTHTSGMQARFLEQNQPPVKIIVPGKVFRNENEDATHGWSFTQVEGLVVGEGVALSDLKGTLNYFIQGILGRDTEIRLRPSFFPYTEPSVEVDAKFRGEWLEMLGAGMVHPKVLESAGVDSARYTGFAFGVGVERMAQVKFGMTDLRQNWRPDLAYLEQF